MNIEFFSSTMNDDRISFKIIMLIFISNNFHFWIEELKNLALKIKMWQYINSNENMKKSKNKILLEIDHFSIKDFNSQSVTNDLMTNQTISTASSYSRFVQWFHELTSNQQKNYRASVKEYKWKEKLIVKISERMFKRDEAIRVFARSYIFFEMMSIFIRKILQLLIIKYKKIDDQIKKQLHEKFQALKQSSFKNQIETWIIDWKNLRNRILIFDIKDFFDFETMFVEKFLIADRKWVSTFCDNWILQKKAIERNVHFAETIREYKNVVKKNLKIVEHANAIILQNQSQSQSQSQKSTFSILSKSDKSEKRQCVCEVMHDWKNCEHIVKSVKLSNWKCNQQKRKWIKNAILKSRSLFYALQRIIDIDILNDIKAEQCKSKEKDNNDKKSNSEKTANDDISDVKFANMINRRSSKYVNLFINKTFNNFLWKSVIYDFDCNDSFIYDLNRFVNEITSAHEMIETSNDFMLIEEYEIMLVIDRINEKNRRMFFDNIVYVSFTDVILMFVTRLKKQEFVWNMYKKVLMNKSIDAVICDIEKKHDLLFSKYRSIEKFVNSVQSHKKILAKTIFLNWHLRLEHCRSKMINQFKKIDEIEVTQENASKIVQCDTCAISKMHRLIQRTSSAKAIKIFQILHFDLIICNKTINETTCIAHFIDELIFYNRVFSLMNHKKKTLMSILKNLIN